jgi:hypothetical protein
MQFFRLLDAAQFVTLAIATVILLVNGDTAHGLMCGIWTELCALGRILYRIEKAKGSG